MSNIVAHNESLTPEERKESSRRAVLAHQKNARERKIAHEKIENCRTTLVEEAEIYIKAHAKELIETLGSVALAKTVTSRDRLTAINMLADITGQKAAVQVKLGSDSDKPFALIDMSSMSTAQLQKLLTKYESEPEPDDDLVIIDEDE